MRAKVGLLIKPTIGGGGGVQPSVRSGTSIEIGTTSSPSISKPSGAASGDRVLIFLSTEDSTTVTCTARPTLFTRLGGGTEADPVVIDTTGGDMRGFIYQKTLDGSEGSSFSFTMSASTYMSAAAICVQNPGAISSAVYETADVVGGDSGRLLAVTLSATQLALAFGITYLNGPVASVTNWTEPTGSTTIGFYRTTTLGTNQAFNNASGAQRWMAANLIMDAA